MTTYRCMRVQCSHPLRLKNWTARHSRRIDKKFEGTPDAGKAWFANNSKGLEAGLSMCEVRLRPLSSSIRAEESLIVFRSLFQRPIKYSGTSWYVWDLGVKNSGTKGVVSMQTPAAHRDRNEQESVEMKQWRCRPGQRLSQSWAG